MKDSFILIAEDDVDDILLLESAFSETGFEGILRFVDNGEKLLVELGHLHTTRLYPSVIILDLNMPRKGGLEVLREIRKDPALDRVRIIVFSTTKNEHEVKECLHNGASYYFVKPIHYSDLIGFAREIQLIAAEVDEGE